MYIYKIVPPLYSYSNVYIVHYFEPRKTQTQKFGVSLISMLYCDYRSMIVRNCERNEYTLVCIHYDTYTWHTQAITLVSCAKTPIYTGTETDTHAHCIPGRVAGRNDLSYIVNSGKTHCK